MEMQKGTNSVYTIPEFFQPSLNNVSGLMINVKSTIFTNHITNILVYIFNNVIGLPLISAGIIANIFNIVVFSKQGFKDTINISFTSLSVSDLAYLIHTLWQTLSMFPSLRNIRWPFNFSEIVLVTGSIPRVYFSRVSSLITVYIAVERCVSVIRPLQVKFIFTRKRIIFFAIGIYVFNVLPFLSAYYTTRVVWKLDLKTNRTYLGVNYIYENRYIDNIFTSFGVIMALATFISVAVCAIVLVLTLHKQSRWRSQSMSSKTPQTTGQNQPAENRPHEVVKSKGSKNDNKRDVYGSGNDTTKSVTSKPVGSMSERDKRAATTVTLLAIMFVLCYLPGALFQIALVSTDEFSRTGLYRNAYAVFGLIGLRAENACAGANILVYFKTSTRFKDVMMSMFQKTGN